MGIISSSGDSSLSAGCIESDREKVMKNQETIGKRLIMEQNAGKTTAKSIVNSKRDRQIERLKENGTIRDNTGRHEVGFGGTRVDTTYGGFLRKKVGTTQRRFHYDTPSSTRHGTPKKIKRPETRMNPRYYQWVTLRIWWFSLVGNVEYR